MFRTLFAWSSILLLLGGCAPSPSRFTGPVRATPVKVENWNFRNKPARVLETLNYRIHTTIDDDDAVLDLAQLMEGALSQYRRIAPSVQLTDEPMECFLFQSRPEWAIFTKNRTGADAAVYLQISRGGYTVRDWYVAYFIGDVGTYSVAAHEGFHQFVARHFKTRPPPFLEEGLATMFEEVRWERRLPRWDLSHNNGGRMGLRNALEDGTLIPLERLVAMHAGQIVERPRQEVEAFYAQSWGFARFLWEGEGGRHRSALQRLLEDAAAGTLYSDGGLRTTVTATWKPKSVKPMLEYYLGERLPEIEKSYLRYIRRIAYSSYRPPPDA